MEELKSFIFDVDGVLVDSEYANFHSLYLAVREAYGIEISQEEDDDMGPIPTFKKIEKILSRRNCVEDSHLTKQLLKRKFEILLENEELISFNPQIFSVFEYLKANNKNIAIVSNARLEYIDFIIAKFNIATFVDITVGNNSGFLTKPHPDMYIHAIEVLGNPKKNSIIFEDSDIGLRAANNSGAKVKKINSYLDLNLDFIKQL